MEELLNRFKQKAENSFKNVVESKSKIELLSFSGDTALDTRPAHHLYSGRPIF